MSEENTPKTARSYRASVVGDNTVVSINLKWAGQVLVLVAGLVYSYLQVENRIAELERRMELADSQILELVDKNDRFAIMKIAKKLRELGENYNKEYWEVDDII